jgi:hypothetical protein
VSCKTISKDEFERTIPVKPPKVKRNTNPKAHINEGVIVSQDPCKVVNHLNTLIPVGTAITIVTVVKYARVSTSIPTVNIWCPQTTNPKIPIVNMA